MQNDHAPDDRVAALQAQIRRAGRAAGRLKRGLLVVLLGLALVWALRIAPANAVVWAEWLQQQQERLIPGLAICRVSDQFLREDARRGGLEYGIPAAIGLALALTVAYRSVRRRRLGAVLPRLPGYQRVVVLAPLFDDRNRETRRIVWPLLAELGRDREVTPAAAPEATGAEVSAG